MPSGTDERQRELFERAADFARQNLNDDIPGRNRDGVFDRAAWKLCAEFGLLKMAIPDEGESMPRLSDLIAVMEGLGYGSDDQGLLFSLNAHLWTTMVPLVLYGTQAQRERYLPGLADGTLIGANASTEPEAGSDVYAMKTTARPADGGGYFLDGTKTYITSAPVADLLVIYATLDEEAGPLGITAFLVDADTPGLERSPAFDKMGLRTAAMGRVDLKQCWVPDSAVLGRPGRGSWVFESAMEYERGSILAACLGVMRRQVENAVQHARRRQQFGEPIGKFQAVSHRIAEMKVRLDAARALVQRIGVLKDEGKDATLEAAVAKLYVSEAYVQSSLDAVRLQGAKGYLSANPESWQLRDAVGSLLYSGTSDIQHNIIARELGL
ncbi:acyl-CoA dehydrogenase family protein [Kitasatospora sp. NPDC048298]|uniref:acyl-CoA dehydrogenase family protein n=1 Tax=Kitasatospora sp. NPDC048298 TaxID=3364049 RepID=UPI0037209E08